MQHTFIGCGLKKSSVSSSSNLLLCANSLYFCCVVSTAAAQVLSKGHHVLHNVELIVRKPVPKDRCSLLLLRGINPNTCLEMIELYVENMIGLDAVDYTLSPAPGRDFIFIHLSQPFSKGIYKHSASFCL